MLGLRQRTGLFDPHAIARPGFALFIVRVEFLVRRHDLLELRMRKTPFDATMMVLAILLEGPLRCAPFPRASVVVVVVQA